MVPETHLGNLTSLFWLETGTGWSQDGEIRIISVGVLIRFVVRIPFQTTVADDPKIASYINII